MSEKYGPQTYQIKKLLERAKTLSNDEQNKLDAGYVAIWSQAWLMAYKSSEDVARDLGKARHKAWDDIGGAVWGVANALLVQDLIGETFTQEHYDLLTKPWRDVIGELESL